MSRRIITTTKLEDAASFIALSILKQLKSGKHVLLFIAGGSAIPVAVKVSELLREKLNHDLMESLTVALTDERYGPVNHTDSNWHQLTEKGFDLPEAKLMPVLTGDDRAITVKKFNAFLSDEFSAAREDNYKIGLFGIGSDGHTAGILPESEAVHSQDFACGYDTPTFSRITLTRRSIEELDEAVLWAQGEEKWPILESMEKNNLDIFEQPAQILKQVPLLTIFTNYDGTK